MGNIIPFPSSQEISNATSELYSTGRDLALARFCRYGSVVCGIIGTSITQFASIVGFLQSHEILPLRDPELTDITFTITSGIGYMILGLSAYLFHKSHKDIKCLSQKRDYFLEIARKYC